MPQHVPGSMAPSGHLPPLEPPPLCGAKVVQPPSATGPAHTSQAGAQWLAGTQIAEQYQKQDCAAALSAAEASWKPRQSIVHNGFTGAN